MIQRPPGDWSQDPEVIELLNAVQDLLNKIGCSRGDDMVIVILLNLLAEVARRNGYGKWEVPRLLINVWEGLEWMDNNKP
ncbi:MAG: hypothetical protein WA618_06715 [Terriglobales bacterium]